MKDPPDPGDFVPPAGVFVTVQSNNESGMDTDGSSSARNLKRSRMHVCKHCNKRRRTRKHHGGSESSGCGCMESQSAQAVESAAIHSENIISKVLPNDIPAPSMVIPTQIGRKTYDKTDSAPFVIHVQKIITSPDDGTTLHPITFGKFLKYNDFQNIINGSVKKIGRNKISLSFSSFLDANSFITHNSLEKHNFKAFIPTFNVTRMGLVRGVPAEWSPEEVIDNITVPIGCGPILKVRRLNFKTIVDGSTIWKPSQSIVVTFDGQILPKRVFMCYNALPVELYIFPTIQCFNCCRFGHTRIQCRSKPRCYKCGQGHTGDSCDREQESTYCCLCSGVHFAINKSCPEFCRQKLIKTYMAQSSVSYAEAAKVHPPVTKSYANALLSSPSKNFANIPPVPSPNNTPAPSSYKKTVFLKPHSPPKSIQGYNKEAHNAIIKDWNIPQPSNGCVISNNHNNDFKDTNFSLNDFLSALHNLLSQFNFSPSNAAPSCNTSQSIHNGQHQNNPVELPQSH
ncbi:hypothetical protein PYW07_003710 [Mythimna separata]|uniref:CCHC-type domain-containing protein n=1 Tax=Mythimna separata TaxID=271217 RepID=A0AAD7YQ38_MYTSE|nr:hypothetical protein PYW07_003710 [Mythimna separata]